MLFDVALYTSLAVLVAGLAYKLGRWLTTSIGPESRNYTPAQRLSASLKGLARALGSRSLGPMMAALVSDGLFQRRSLGHSRWAWAAHMLIFWGMMGLIFLHALGPVLIPSFTATLNPWLFLRNLFGVMLLAGAVMALWRRLRLPGLRRTTHWADRAALALLALLVLSGFALEGAKIISVHSFDQMIEEYGSLAEDNDRAALGQVWREHYGVAFPQGQVPAGLELMEQGLELHQDSCVDCHDMPQWAFASWPLSRAMAPMAGWLESVRAALWLYYLHFLAAFAALAILPFSKFLHIFTGPLLLMIRVAVPREDMDPAARALVRALELDVCTHCGACSVHCSVAEAVNHVPNLAVLPSEKLMALGRLARGKTDYGEMLDVMRQGAYMCTSCLRCTLLCPVGINLQDLWFAMKDDLEEAGYGPTSRAVAGQAGESAGPSRKVAPFKVASGDFQRDLGLSVQSGSFRNCYRCATCSNSCPVVFSYENPKEELDLLPHQIMHSLGLGLSDEALGARMTWYCLTCYRCQEACPQGVKVADVLYELRNLAAARQGQGESC
ncbi:MAG: 4Fe-4S dicluster domain-containing protein [Desulfarculaceae bacterium]|nr:4Fe-4S dicluster domain-containing protein [Desulfarculaceae bacterium]MCF8046714.1 4Fe-4S dicluster domain-containing protein [Desulfarculaceae bacterium]MCF8065310.1 4Fe-4S dicluster domain-containing protein [Desulfarculaceae bacterium]MCF8099205.1 4Fe-4S dicluster domain-containing protein [Desulfarculaceae bacterium]MCF8122521.1 4Fe-4S dicluster domain-containing protein [Desulfarculaceae bacterium]